MSNDTIPAKLLTYFLIMKNYLEYSKDDVENEFTKYIRPYCCFTYSGRSALYLVYKSLRMKKGEIITTPLTCSAAIFPILYCGLKPKFADIDPETYNILPDAINETISKNTKAVQVIHLAGNPCEMKAIKEICEDHKLLLIEDCAQAFGAEYEGKNVGTFGDISCFSFSKPPFGIRGGMITSKEKNVISNIKNYQNKFLSCVPISILGRDFERLPFKILKNLRPLKYDNYRSDFETFLFKPSKLLSSIAMFRLRNFHNILEHYIQNGLLLTEEFSNLAGIKLQKDTKNSKRVFTKFMLETDKNCIDVIKRLRERNIYATHLTTENGGLYQQRFDLHPLYNLVTKNCKNYLHLHDRIITLPISHNMNKNEIKYYKEQLDNILNRGEN